MNRPMLSLIPDFDLSAHNTFGLSARSRFGAVITDAAHLPELFAEAEQRRLPVRILGGGSNVVLAPFFDGITALVATKGRKVVDQSGETTVLEVQGGENWHDLVAWTVQNRFWGLENLAGIPGTVGAAPVQNIGAYGVELVERFDSLTAFDRAKREFVTFGKETCAFAYRNSIFKRDKGRYVVILVRLALPQPWVPVLSYPGLTELREAAHHDAGVIMDTVLALRQSKLPDWRITGNAGSFFHNPIISAELAARITAEHPGAPAFPQADGRVKLSAGWLIDRCGFKGFRLGPVGVSDSHALVLVNHGGGTQADIAALAARIKAGVRERFGVTLQEEPEFF